MTRTPDRNTRSSTRPVYLMVFFSGFAGLVYQVLWMKQLGFLFGNTAHAAAATLAAFFAGLAVGSGFWGRRTRTISNPLRIYAWLETGIAFTALTYFVVLRLFYLLYPLVYRSTASRPLLLAIKFALALVLVFPPAFFMGGTIPVIGQFLIRKQEQLGIRAALLYGVNTMGAAMGAFLAGFFLVLFLGQRVTCITAIAITCAIALTAYRLSRPAGEPFREPEEKQRQKQAKSPVTTASRRLVYVVCFLSGFGVLALEVVWTRIFAQVHENSTYSFSLVLVIVLLSLSLGAMIASRLARLSVPSMSLLASLMILSGLAISVSPFMLMHMTDNLVMLKTGTSFLRYMSDLFLKGVVFIGLPALTLGTVFPFLMKTEELFAFEPGRSLGRLSAVNTVGAILGSIVCGFVMLELLGMWRTMQVIAALYLVAGMILTLSGKGGSIAMRAAGAVILVLLFTGLSPVRLPATGRDPARPPESVLAVWETSDCTVSVAGNVYGDRLIRINSNYILGSTGAVAFQEFQGRLPLMVYPRTKSVFFLGLGTGVTAGAALHPQFQTIERVVACELVSEVVTAARRYMAGELSLPCPLGRRCNHGAGLHDFTGGLFRDARAEILIEDGRHYLMAAEDTFDMINADLFLPYRSGAGSLYSREHFENARERLNPGGVFVQWLPLFQITANEFGIIAHTMLTVFEQVTLWRNGFAPGQEVFALVGHRDAEPLPATELEMSHSVKRSAIAGLGYRNLRDLEFPLNEQAILLFYCGNITAAEDLFRDYPVNTDDKPLIEYMAPLTIRRNLNTMIPTFVGPKIVALVDRILERCPPAKDPMLKNRSAADRRLPLAGSALHRAWVDAALRDERGCKTSWDLFVREWIGDGTR